MRIGVNIGPTADWQSMLAAARTADELGFETVGFLDHYHTQKSELHLSPIYFSSKIIFVFGRLPSLLYPRFQSKQASFSFSTNKSNSCL